MRVRRLLVITLLTVAVAAPATLVATVPVAAAPAPSAAPAALVAATRPAKYVVLRLRATVVAGDSLARIARRYGVGMEALRLANGLSRRAVLRPGQVLRIPDIKVPWSLVAKLPRGLVLRTERLRLVPVFAAAAAEAGIPADLLMALAWRESNWNATALSRTGAMGIGQLKQSTVEFASLRLLRAGRLLDPWEPSDNLRMSARTLRYLLDRTNGDVFRALVAYYQGFGSLTRQGVLPLGQRYADGVLALRPTFQA